ADCMARGYPRFYAKQRMNASVVHAASQVIAPRDCSQSSVDSVVIAQLSRVILPRPCTHHRYG
ncbi:MAG: hypothetical protein Q4A74_04035, partial [Cardiobacteriaceae bacterium]|nr:hypothetical protein [Cardiobacteriaceae bacterium]